jgi:hypothetical protein
MQKTILTLATLIALAGSASAGDRYRDRYAAPPPPSALGAPGARYYGPVNNYYAPVTIYAGGSYAYPSAYPSAYPAYAAGYATAPECDANCYGAGYDWSHGYSYSGGYAYGYPAYGYYGYPPSNEGVRMDPWAGYNWGPNNGYW